MRRERRECARQVRNPWLLGARLRHGFEVTVIDLAPGGALVEGTGRLLPGSSVELHLSGDGWQWVGSARVLRCFVAAVIPDHGVRYRAALRFAERLEAPCGWNDRVHEACPASQLPAPESSASPSAAGSSYPSQAVTAPEWEATTRPNAGGGRRWPLFGLKGS